MVKTDNDQVLQHIPHAIPMISTGRSTIGDVPSLSEKRDMSKMLGCSAKVSVIYM